jgi:parvulin-like peptidyl-prolyl isomerase
MLPSSLLRGLPTGLLLLVAVPSGAAQKIRLDGPVAIVNERVITERQVAVRARAIDGGAGPLKKRMEQAYQALFLDAVLAQARTTAAFDERMIDEQVKQQTRYREEQEGSRSELLEVLARQGETLEDYRKKQKEELRRLVLYESLSARIGPTGRPSAEGYFGPRRMKLWYDRNPSEFREPAAIQARRCVALFGGSAASEAEARKRAEGWLASVRGGAELAAIAKAESGWNSSGAGELSGDSSGALQWVSTEPGGTLDPALRRALEGREPGVLPELVRTVDGYAVVELVARRAATRQPFSDPRVQREISLRLRRSWSDEQQRETQDQLRANSYLWPPERLRGADR